MGKVLLTDEARQAIQQLSPAIETYGDAVNKIINLLNVVGDPSQLDGTGPAQFRAELPQYTSGLRSSHQNAQNMQQGLNSLQAAITQAASG
jgi:hypothetical protein